MNGIKARDRYKLIFSIYATSIANPYFVHFVHVHKMFQNTLALSTWARGWKRNDQNQGCRQTIPPSNLLPHSVWVVAWDCQGKLMGLIEFLLYIMENINCVYVLAMASAHIRDDISISSHISQARSVRVNTPFKSTVSILWMNINCFCVYRPHYDYRLHYDLRIGPPVGSPILKWKPKNLNETLSRFDSSFWIVVPEIVIISYYRFHCCSIMDLSWWIFT